MADDKGGKMEDREEKKAKIKKKSVWVLKCTRKLKENIWRKGRKFGDRKKQMRSKGNILAVFLTLIVTLNNRVK